MSDNSGNSNPDSSPRPLSPQTPKSQAKRFQPIVMDQSEEIGESPQSGTVRRKQVSSSGGKYGSLATINTTESSETPSASQTAQDGVASPSQERRESTSAASRSQLLSPDRPAQTPAKSKKPPGPRRASSHMSRHRGQEFSVDDALLEVEQDLAQRHVTPRHAVRRMPSGLRKRAQPTPLATVESNEEGDATPNAGTPQEHPSSSDTEGANNAECATDAEAALEDDAEATPSTEEDESSDAESFTLKDKQDAINQTHPFGVRIWKPALYKKSRSVQKNAEGDIHSSPGGLVSNWLSVFNLCWTIFFGWWLAFVAFVGAVVCYVFAFGFASSTREYGQVLLGLSWYLFYPFGKFVRLEQDEAYLEEDRGEGRSISEYEQWQSGDLEDGRLFFGPVSNRSIIGARRNSLDSASENDSLLGRSRRGPEQMDDNGPRSKRRLFGRGDWNIGRIIFFCFFYFLIAPSLFFVSITCWLMVFWIPMGKVTLLVFRHLRRHPLALSFHSDTSYSRAPESPSSSILLCTYRAVGLKYWKYTVDGTNIFLINLIAVVIFVILDYYVLSVGLGLKFFLTSPAFIFILSLFSIIPLAYFIGQAVASISAQSSMGLGAAINAFFSTIVEVFLYCVALKGGKGQLVEGSVVGSIFAGILFLPGLSMCCGALKRKTQRFNAKSAGVTSTMLLFAVLAAFCPTLFYQIYGTHEVKCFSCVDSSPSSQDCQRCFFSQVTAVDDRFFNTAVRPYTIFAASLLFCAYIIGLWFTLRTHAASIWATEPDEKKMHEGTSSGKTTILSHERQGSSSLGTQNQLSRQNTHQAPEPPSRTAIRESALYKRILGQSLKQVGLSAQHPDEGASSALSSPKMIPHRVPPNTGEGGSSEVMSPRSIHIPGFTEEENQNLVREVAEMAATAATVAARDAVRAPRRTSVAATHPPHHHSKPPSVIKGNLHELDDQGADQAGGGHDAPNWSRTKSSIILLGATFLYAIIAEMLVDTVDVVLSSVDIDEKFLGITLFALVPNTTEFLNAISFAMNGNIALSMEIGSAYALQVCLLQVPALVLYSAFYSRFLDPSDIVDHTFTLIFPQWDMVTVILCVFLLSYMYGEGKSNYFKGSILILSYLVVVVGYYFSGFTDEAMQDQRIKSFKTIGRGRSVFALPPTVRDHHSPPSVAYFARSRKAGKFAKSFPPVAADASSPSSKNIAIIGGGIGGALLAKSLVDVTRNLETSINITIFEKADHLGGKLRSHNSNFTADPIELGSQYIPSYWTELNDIIEELGLETVPATTVADFGIWDSDEENYIYEEKSWQPDWWKSLHRRIRWGTVPPLATDLFQKAQRALFTMPQETFEDFTFIQEALKNRSAKNFMSYFNVSGPFVDDYINSAARARYGQTLSELNGLAATISLKEDTGIRIRQGNQALVDGIARASGATVCTGTEVKTVERQTGLDTYTLTYDVPDVGFNVDETFDMVIVAAPFGTTNITFVPTLEHWHTPELRSYIPQHITHLRTTHKVSGPGHINVRGSHAPVNSMRLVQRFPANGAPRSKEYFVYRITSSTYLSRSTINRFFDPHKVSWIHRHEWNAALPSQQPLNGGNRGIPFELESDGSLFYTSGLDMFGGGLDLVLHWSKMFATVAACRKLGGSCDDLPHGQELIKPTESDETLDL
ncbi:MAG: hypothetical protein M1814_004428 [Vezdaea aestivalis]|nr:MAG: hypothetical protein M1814_004428 [Vezdaea aestivalis]